MPLGERMRPRPSLRRLPTTIPTASSNAPTNEAAPNDTPDDELEVEGGSTTLSVGAVAAGVDASGDERPADVT